MTIVYDHLALFFSLFTTKTLTCTNPKPCTDTESRWYYSWNACYVFSTNERMKKNKQRGQIKREKGSREENTEGEKRKEWKNGAYRLHLVWTPLHVLHKSESAFVRANEGSDGE